MGIVALILYFLAWVMVGTGIYFLLPSWVLVLYGFGTMAWLLIWAGIRKKTTLNDRANQ